MRAYETIYSIGNTYAEEIPKDLSAKQYNAKLTSLLIIVPDESLVFLANRRTKIAQGTWKKLQFKSWREILT